MATETNRRTRTVATGLVVSVVLVVVAGAIGYRMGAASNGSSVSNGAAVSTPPGTSAPMLLSGPVATGFAADMLDHHAQAVLLADFVTAHGNSDTVRAMAYSIVSGQRYESGLLDQYLRDRELTRPGSDQPAMGWMGESVNRDRMPGLLSSAEVAAILNASGEELDRLFLEAMIRHHEGGVHMAQYAADHAESSDMRSLAGRMLVEQQTEIGDMRAALAPPPN